MMLALMPRPALLLIFSVAAFAFAGSLHAAEPAKVLRHVVLFKFNDDAGEAQVQKIVDAFRALPSQIDAIQDFEYGTDVSPEGKADGFTHCFLVTFADEQARDAYLPHPAHQAFVKQLRPLLDKALVVDYWTQQ